MTKITKRQRRNLRKQGIDLKNPEPQSNIMAIKRIEPLTDNQEKVFDSYDADQNLMISGYAGTGKTFISMGLALEQILSGKSPYKKLIIVRSAVATRDIGFLPGNAKEKTSVYEAPYASNAAKLFGRADAYEILKSKGIIEFMPTSYVRGITCDNAIILVDEIQNLSYHESSSIITRAGNDCRYILVGDYRQSDLRGKEKEDVKKIIRICSIMPSFDFVEMGTDDIVRSGLVREFILASEKIESDLQA